MQNILQAKKIILIVFNVLHFIEISAGKATFTAESNIIYREKRQSSNGTGCLLPPHPQNGMYSLGDGSTYFENTYTETSSIIGLKCNEGFQTSEIQTFYCVGTSWVPEIANATCTHSNSSNRCTTPKKEAGECIILPQCPPIMSILQLTPITTENVQYLGQSRCGFEGSEPKVCCPLQTAITTTTTTTTSSPSETCPSLPSTDTYDTRCYHRKVEVSCDNPPDGTLARTICKPLYIYRGTRTNPLCRNGFWDSNPTPCEPDSYSSNRCTTPKKEVGECIILTKCAPIASILEITPVTTENVQYLRQSGCGFEGSEPKVCCPLQTITTTTTTTSSPLPSGTCPSLPPTDTYDTHCYHRDAEVSCKNPPDGTLARTTCKSLYVYRGTRVNPLCRNGFWDFNPTPCEPVCGQKNVNPLEVIIGGINVTKGEYPWMVAIYNISSNPQEHICGGTIISRFYVLSAAHCFTNRANGVRYPKEYFSIVAGKYYRDLNIQEDGVQRREIKRLVIHENYKASLGKFRDDIAVIEIERLHLSLTIQPVCVDWDNLYEEFDFSENNTAVVAGWGFTKQDSAQAEVLKKLTVAYISKTVCKEHMDPDFFEQYHTSDTICAGVKDEGRSVCKGDSGGGLYFKSLQTSFFIRGIVSLTKRSETGCDSNHYALYTKVSTYLRWIERITRKIT